MKEDKNCYAQILCADFEHAVQIRADFEKTCKAKKLWKFANEQVMGSVHERMLYLYRLELMMGKDVFSTQFEKDNIIPFFPLLCFPDASNKNYGTYQK